MYAVGVGNKLITSEVLVVTSATTSAKWAEGWIAHQRPNSSPSVSIERIIGNLAP